jgi:hypothetical protein
VFGPICDLVDIMAQVCYGLWSLMFHVKHMELSHPLKR